jgi:hypothetical protein
MQRNVKGAGHAFPCVPITLLFMLRRTIAQSPRLFLKTVSSAENVLNFVCEERLNRFRQQIIMLGETRLVRSTFTRQHSSRDRSGAGEGKQLWAIQGVAALQTLFGQELLSSYNRSVPREIAARSLQTVLVVILFLAVYRPVKYLRTTN